MRPSAFYFAWGSNRHHTAPSFRMARKNVTSSSLYWVRPSSSLPSPLLAEQLDDDEDEVANDKDDEGVPWSRRSSCLCLRSFWRP
mmetsp:Transcript_45838/g.85295  ORF Transcript_45838/g.85295 Transcript_45838/m.85295 type:complete len:85 (-) Transcript_45838:744-998(-)